MNSQQNILLGILKLDVALYNGHIKKNSFEKQ